MSSGRVHFAANVVGGVGLLIVTAWYAPAQLSPVAAGALLGTLITPDADLESTTHSEALLRSIPLVGILFQIFWYPYALLHRHRGVSHWPLIGTTSRVLYSLALTYLGAALLTGLLPPTGPEPARWLADWRTLAHALTNVWLLAAWLVQDVLHLVLDSLGDS